MSTSAAAAIHVRGHLLRYVEIKRTDATWSVAAVGRYVFDDDIASRILGAEDTSETVPDVDSLPEKIRDLLPQVRGRVVVHPTQVYSFFVPLPAGASPSERREQVLQQVALVAGPAAATDRHVFSSVVRSAPDQQGTSYDWVHVLALPEGAVPGMQAIVGAEAADEWDWMVSSEGAAHSLRPAQLEEKPSGLLVGAYTEHTEFSLVQAGEWHHAQCTDAAKHTEDVLYFARAFLNRSGLSSGDVEALWAYGDAVDSGIQTALEADTGCEVRVLDPFAELAGEVDVDAAGRPAFAPCVGAALKELSAE